MKKKVTIYTTTGGKIEFRGYKEMNDDYFLSLYVFDLGVKKIIRQYYPLKDNEKVVIFDRENMDLDTKRKREIIENLANNIKNRLDKMQ